MGEARSLACENSFLAITFAMIDQRKIYIFLVMCVYIYIQNGRDRSFRDVERSREFHQQLDARQRCQNTVEFYFSADILASREHIKGLDFIPHRRALHGSDDTSRTIEILQFALNFNFFRENERERSLLLSLTVSSMPIITENIKIFEMLNC